jgi:putative ABC transport system permease protein
MTSLILHTILALLLLILPFGALYILDRPSIRPLAIALAKGLIQLLIFSLVVWGVFKVDNTWINIVWFLAMTLWGGWMIVSKCKLSVKDYLLPASAGLFVGVLGVGLWLLVAVLPIDAITARWFVPIMAILIGHSASMQVRGLSTFVSLITNNRAQYDFLIGNGASKWQALMPFMRSSLLAIISPTITNLSALALATLPLLFCGMLLGGLSPINAFAVMLYSVIGCIASSVLSLGVTLVLAKTIKNL